MSDGTMDMSPEERNEFIGDFLAESEGHLQVLNEKLLVVEEAEKTGKTLGDDDVNAMFRSAHTIKGTASFIGLVKTVRLTHKLETILQKIKNKEMVFTDEIVDVLFKAFDVLESLFESLRNKSEEDVDVEEGVKLIEGVLGPEKKEDHAEETAKEEAAPEEEKPKKAEEKPEEAAETKEEAEKKEEKDEKREINLKYLEQFLVEAEQYIEEFNQTLLVAEKEKDNKEAIDKLFRIVHTIKGSAGIVNIAEVCEVSHVMEDILSVFRERKTVPEAETASLLFQGIDLISLLVLDLKKMSKIETDVSKMCELLVAEKIRLKTIDKDSKREKKAEKEKETDIDSLTKLDSLSEEKQKLVEEYIQKDYDTYGIILRADESIILKSAKVAIAEERLNKNGGVITIRPSFEEIDAQVGGDAYAGVVFCSVLNEKEIHKLLVMEGINVYSIERIDTREKEEAKEEVPEAIPETHQTVKEGAGMVEAINDKGVPEQDSGAKAAPIEISTVRVDARKLDILMNLSGELVIVRSQFARLVKLFNDDVEEQKRLSRITEQMSSAVDSFDKDFKD